MLRSFVDECTTRAAPPRECSPTAFLALAEWTRKLLRPKSQADPVTLVDADDNVDAAVTAEPKARLDLAKLNPSLFVVGLDTVERILPRYLLKAGIACERMQHAQLPVPTIRLILEAAFSVAETETQQSEAALRDVFSLFDSSGDGNLDEDEFLAVLPLLGEDVPAEVVAKLFAAGDVDKGGTIDGTEFVRFLRTVNPVSDGALDGWRALLPEDAAQADDMILLHVGRRGGRHGSTSSETSGTRPMRGGDGEMFSWEVVPPADIAYAQRLSDEPWSRAILISRPDLANTEALIRNLRPLGFKDDEVRAVARAIFVTGDDDDYARVFEILDRDHTGGIDPFEFRALIALLGNHATEAEARELFLSADNDNDGSLDVAEFVALLRRISPKASSATEAQQLREEIGRERLQARITSSSLAEANDPAHADAMVQVLVLGASRVGKTYLLNQVLADKLPKGSTIAVGVGAVVVRIGVTDVAVQVLDTPGDARFAPLGRLFMPRVAYAVFVFDATSFDTFEALQPLFDEFTRVNPHVDPSRQCCLVANCARLGVKRAVSAGFAADWAVEHGDMARFEVSPEAPQGILDPLRALADEYLTANPEALRQPQAAEVAAPPPAAVSPMGSTQERARANRRTVGFA